MNYKTTAKNEPLTHYEGIEQDEKTEDFYGPDDDIGAPESARCKDAAADAEHGPGVEHK